jgi:very-short-patch-repair endonuclease
MQPYNQKLITNSRTLRSDMTDAERLLWKRIRFKQMRGLLFYRQKPLLKFIVDFYCPKAKLVIELDGSQHFEEVQRVADAERDAALTGLGLRVLRFDNRQVLMEIDAVMAEIDRVVCEMSGQREV